MVAEAERGGGVAEAVHHLRQGGAGIGRRMALADKRARPVLQGRGRAAVGGARVGRVGRTKVRRSDMGSRCAAAPIWREKRGRSDMARGAPIKGRSDIMV